MGRLSIVKWQLNEWDERSPERITIAKLAFAAVLGFCAAACAALHGAQPEAATSRLQQTLAPEYDEGVSALRKRDYSAALTKFTNAAKKGDGDALFFIGMLYDRGCGVHRDPEEAQHLWERGAAAHSAAAKFWLALAMAFGNGPADKIDELEREAAEGGYPRAMDAKSQQPSADGVESLAWKRVAMRRWEKALGGRVGREEWWSEKEQALEQTQAKLSEGQLRTANQLADDLDRRIPLPRPGTVDENLLTGECS